MASINQLISEIAHSVQGADSIPVRRAIRLAIVHARNELIRHSAEQHRYVDKVLQQRFRVSLVSVPDGDINVAGNTAITTIKRTNQRVPRPTRLTNNLPFLSVRTVGVTTSTAIPFVRESVMRHYESLPGMCPNIGYDYINDYIYVFTNKNSTFNELSHIVIESVFEKPEIIDIETNNGVTRINDDDEYLLPEDMIGNIKKLVMETFNPNIVRQTDEVPNPNLVK